MELMKGFDSNYRFVLVAARRARQLQSGSRPMIEVNTRKPTRVAMEEVNAGLVKWQIIDKPKTAVEVAEEFFATSFADR